MPAPKCKKCGALLLVVMGGGSNDDGSNYQLCGGCAGRNIEQWRDEGLTFTHATDDAAPTIERGARLLLLPQGTPVVGLVSMGVNGVYVMREGGAIARVEAERLAPWSDNAAWTGPELDWLALPLGMRLTVEYYEAKSRLLSHAGVMLSDRETAGLLIVTHGLADAAAGPIAATFAPAVAALLREAESERPPG